MNVKRKRIGDFLKSEKSLFNLLLLCLFPVVNLWEHLPSTQNWIYTF